MQVLLFYALGISTGSRQRENQENLISLINPFSDAGLRDNCRSVNCTFQKPQEKRACVRQHTYSRGCTPKFGLNSAHPLLTFPLQPAPLLLVDQQELWVIPHPILNSEQYLIPWQPPQVVNGLCSFSFCPLIRAGAEKHLWGLSALCSGTWLGIASVSAAGISTESWEWGEFHSSFEGMHCSSLKHRCFPVCRWGVTESLVSGGLGKSEKKKLYLCNPLPPTPLQTSHWLFLRWKGLSLPETQQWKEAGLKRNNNTDAKTSLSQDFPLLIFLVKCFVLIFSSSGYGRTSWKWSSSGHALYFCEPGVLPVPGRFHSHKHWHIPPP